MAEALPDEYEVEVVTDNAFEPVSPFGELGEDAFNVELKEIKTLGGLSPNTKKRITRELNKVMRGVDGAKSDQLQPPKLVGTGYGAFDVAIPPYNLEYLAKIYEINAANYAAVNAKVSNIVGLGYEWIESPKMRLKLDAIEEPDKLNRTRKKLAASKIDLNEWLDKLNEEDTFLETLSKAYTDLEATGNGYIEIGRKVNGEIGYIGHIPSTTIRVRLARDGFVQIIGDKAVFFRNFGDLKRTDPVGNDRRPNELVHLKKYSPSDSFYGIPDIIAAKNALAGSEYASRYNLDYFEHKAVPRYVIVIKGAKLSPTAEGKVVDFFRGNLKGKSHRTLYIPLPASSDEKPVEFEMKPVEVGKQEGSFGEYDEKNTETILMAHRTPRSKVAGATGEALAAAKDADRTFKETVCRPAQDVLQKKLNKIFAERTDAFVIHLRELTLTDETEQAKIDQVYMQYGVDVANEIRTRRGKPGIKGGDKPWEPPQKTATPGSNANGTRTRDAARAVNSPDRGGQGRKPKGEGRTQA